MKIVIIGGTGLIGSKTFPILRRGGHEVVAASPKSGVNTITGEGLKEALAGAQVVIDLGWRPAGGRSRPRGQILRRPGRGAFARAVGRGAPRRHRSRRMAPPLTGGSLTPDPFCF